MKSRLRCLQQTSDANVAATVHTQLPGAIPHSEYPAAASAGIIELRTVSAVSGPGVQITTAAHAGERTSTTCHEREPLDICQMIPDDFAAPVATSREDRRAAPRRRPARHGGDTPRRPSPPPERGQRHEPPLAASG